MAEESVLEVLACDITVRPAGAPGFTDVVAGIRTITRIPGRIEIDFDPAMTRDVSALVEAERLCCAGLEWDLQTASGLVLRIAGTELQLDALESLTKR
jgi:hypothetical protein